ncbi:DUF1611 domain-containing protein [candidate division KSB1 bacterium]|nr:DUF1611 domain-containing protein [candidate division KSB1 bacterium]
MNEPHAATIGRSGRRYIILTEGQTHPTPAKLAASLLRYRPEQVVALLDSTVAGRDAGDLLGCGQGIPIVADLQHGIRLGGNALLLGITPAGGRVPDNWRALIREAIDCGLAIISGMHTLLNDCPEWVERAQRSGSELIDLRLPPADLSVNGCRAAKHRGLRIHTVGSDCNCGKKVASLEIDREFRRRGYDSEFIATGQSGITISGKGIAIDHVIADYVAGAAERLVLENSARDILVIEGQGAITHPLYSGVTLSMLHGFCPQVLVLCHQVDRKIMRGSVDTPVADLGLLIDLYERVTAPVFPARVIAIALNTASLSDQEAREVIQQTQSKFVLPVTDVIRQGAVPIVDALVPVFKTLINRRENP